MKGLVLDFRAEIDVQGSICGEHRVQNIHAHHKGNIVRHRKVTEGGISGATVNPRQGTSVDSYISTIGALVMARGTALKMKISVGSAWRWVIKNIPVLGT